MKQPNRQFPLEVYNYFRVLILDREVSRFLIVGGVVFSANQLFLYLLHGLIGLRLVFAQIIASELATVVSFVFHHHWTYRNYNSRPLLVRFLHFNLTALGGIIIANATSLVCVYVFGINYLIGFSFGAILAIFWNYFANKHFIWAQTIND